VASQKRQKIADLGVEEQRHFPAITIIAINGVPCQVEPNSDRAALAREEDAREQDVLIAG